VILWKKNIRGGFGGHLWHLKLLYLVVGMEDYVGKVCVITLRKRE
jgi:hypothetical protein